MLHHFNYFETVRCKTNSTTNKRLYKMASLKVNYKTLFTEWPQRSIPAKYGFLNAESAFDHSDQQTALDTKGNDKRYRRWSLNTSSVDKGRQQTRKGCNQIDCSRKEGLQSLSENKCREGIADVSNEAQEAFRSGSIRFKSARKTRSWTLRSTNCTKERPIILKKLHQNRQKRLADESPMQKIRQLSSQHGRGKTN